MKYHLTKLNNGLRVLTIPMAGTKAVTVIALIRAGSRHETQKTKGLAHFIEHMFFKGGKKYPDTLTVSSTLDGTGASYNAFTDKEMVGYWIKIASKNLPLALDVLSDMLLSAKFDQVEIERERGTIIEEINLALDTPIARSVDLFFELLFGKNPLGWDTAGEKETIKFLKRKDFLKYLAKFYFPSNMVLVLAGNIIPSKAVSEIKKYFPFQKDKKIKFTSQEFKTKKGLSLKFKKTEQAHLCLGFEGLKIDDPSYVALKVLNALLGGSMSSRLFINVRERKGLAYYIRSMDFEFSDTGCIFVHAGLNINRIEEAIKSILGELKKLKEELVSRKELKKAKEFLEGQTILQMEDSEFLAEFFSKQALLFKKIKTPQDYFTEIDKVKASDIQNLAQKLFREDKLNLAIIGPFKDKKRFEKIY